MDNLMYLVDELYPYRIIFFSISVVFCILLFVFVLTRISIAIKESNEIKNRRLSDDEISNLGKSESSLYDRKLAMRQLASPGGVNPYPLSYMILNDAGQDLYYRTFTIDKLPKRTKFATTFRNLFDFEGCIAQAHIVPLSEDEASSKLDKHIIVLEGEIISAEKNGDTNRSRKMHGQLADAEKWARRIELGEDNFYNVGFLFTIYADSPEQLDLRSDTLNSLAAEKTIELSACYGVQPEAFVSNGPYNKVFDGTYGPIKSPAIKYHRMNKLSLSTLFNHTQEDFTHRNGVPLGSNIRTGRPVLFDPYDPSHNGYGLVAAGMTGTGKSATIKMLVKRLSYFGYKFVCIDSQTVEQRGEYSNLCEALGGSIFQIRTGSNNILNFFDVDEELLIERSANGRREISTLNLLDKMADISNVIQTMVQGKKVKPDFNTASYMGEIIDDCIADVFADKGIVDGQPDSLYTTGRSIDGNALTTGRVRKDMPTLTDFYKRVLTKSKTEERKEYKRAYELILANLKAYIRELYYSRDTHKFFTRDEYEKLPSLKDDNTIRVFKNSEGKYEPVVAIRGMRNYYDGQSTVRISKDTIFTDIDISTLPEDEKFIARQVALLVIKERFVNKNSENAKKAEKLVVIIDEAHEEFPDENTRATIDNFYRTGRKKNVSVWLLTQAIADFRHYKETESILKQSAMKLVFKQDAMDADYIQTVLQITDSQVQRILDLGGDIRTVSNKRQGAARKGEVCIVDNRRVCFCKVKYLKSTEALVVETDPNELERLYKAYVS